MTVLFYTLGCKVNQYDSGSLKEAFLQAGFSPAKKGDDPDVVVVNTCTVTAESDRKGRQAIRRFARQYPDAVIAVTGCMPQARPEKAEDIPEATIVIGNALNGQLPRLVKQALLDKSRQTLWQEHSPLLSNEPLCTESFEGRTRAFVKIEDGCNRFCSYCLIPYARGRVRSKPLDRVKEELEGLAAAGYKEVVLAGINLTAYGEEWGLNLCDGVEAAQAIPGIQRIRLGSMEPDQFTDQMIGRLAACDKLCPQFHLSLQSGSDSVLSRMNRHYDTGFYRDLIGRLRRQFPGCAVTTDVMCAFPGETQEEFEETLAFVEEMAFAKIHTFVYSPREGTPAAARTDQVAPALKRKRADRLNELATRLNRRFLEEQVGSRQPVLIEQRRPDGRAEGHTPRYVPVQVKADQEAVGRVVWVTITGVTEDGACCTGVIS